MRIDAASLDRASAYRLLIGVIAPRPVAWIGSVSADGTDNLSPFSYFMGVGSAPPRLAVSISRGRDGLKHTARNVLATGEFTVSVVEEGDLDRMHATSAPWAGSEFDAVGIPRAWGETVHAPYPEGARVVLECRLAEALDLGDVHLLVGDVVSFHLHDDLFQDGVFDHRRLRPVARLGGDDYSTLGTTLTRPRARTG